MRQEGIPGIAKNEIVQQLQEQLLALQGFGKPPGDTAVPDMGLGGLEEAFPARTFPVGAVHEFVSPSGEAAAATGGFIAGLLGRLMRRGGVCLWVSEGRRIFPPGLAAFGLAPERVVFIDPLRRKDVLWAIEEALRCGTLSAVVGELTELSFMESRRLQLAVERSGVTGFIHRRRPRSEHPVACVSRWKISPLPGHAAEGLPGLGFPRWEVRLEKVRNGRPGTWQLEWSDGGFRRVSTAVPADPCVPRAASHALRDAPHALQDAPYALQDVPQAVPSAPCTFQAPSGRQTTRVLQPLRRSKCLEQGSFSAGRPVTGTG